ncbi:zinc-dependent metalloprotease [Bifidobacterium choloepi]|uniref:Zinc-dependent metalloprotease n=1 Tax=Bifidobacterium choloepi TaxID=2614131 RepID=A0A6I5NHC8_9BIFI|nr:zinc-dependent metalloprotease [Bifidobacterium choloepi]NEG70614.1 zinc-dependent metalloprotease [Bifidobacterium choloepi]
MDDNAIHEWLIKCFGPVQGEMAWSQIQQLPPQIREQLLSQDPSELPDPAQMQAMMTAMSAGGLGTFGGMQEAVDDGPINVKLAKSLALQQASGAGSERIVSAADGMMERRAMSEVNLWLDTACEFDPVAGEADALTRANWVEGTIDKWADIAAPVAKSMNDALTAVIADRLGDIDGEITGMFAGPVPIQIPEGMKDPKQLMKLFATTSYAMQLGQAAGALSHEVRGSYDQGLALLKNPAGGLIMQNVEEYAKSLDIDVAEVTEFLALHEAAYARLYAAVPWLMPRFEALIGKYARGITIDLDAMEEQLREAGALDPEALSGAVNLTNVGIADTPEQKEAMRSIETLLALVEGWVDCVVWRAGMAHIPHIEQLREMTRRERAVGGPAERTFEALMGLELRPKRMREAAALWERITLDDGTVARDAMWGHPDMLPVLPEGEALPAADGAAADGEGTGSAADAAAGTDESSTTIDWDDEFSKLLAGETGDDSFDDDDSSDGGDAADGDDSSEQAGDGGTDGSADEA